MNGYFLCDRGRFGYGFVNSPQRLRQPLLRRRSIVEPVSKDLALEHVAALLKTSRPVLGIGSPRASLEANFALRTLVGPEHFYLGVSEREHRLLSAVLSILRHGPARTPSLHDVEHADAVLVLGEDVTNVAPRLALALRQSVRQQPMRMADQLKIPRWNDAAVRGLIQQQHGPLFIATPTSTRLDDVATQTYRAAPDDVARLGFAVAHALSIEAPRVADLPDDVRTLAARIAQTLRQAERPLVVSGTSLGSEAVLHAAANVAWALCDYGRPAHLCFTVPECNSLGVGLLDGSSLNDAFRAAQRGRVETVMILENDLYRRADTASVRAFFDACRHVVAIDHLTHATTELAEVVLPASTFAEADGTLVSNEGRAQRFFQVFVPAGDVQASWRWLRDVMLATGQDEVSAWQSLDDLIEALAKALPVFADLPDAAPLADFRLAGQKIPRQPHRASGRTAMTAHYTVHEPRSPIDPDTPLAFSMEGYQQPPSPSLMAFFWAPGWNSPQAVNKFQTEVGGPLRGGDPGLRLCEPVADGHVDFFRKTPEAFTPRPGVWLLVPLYHLFGSEELSARAPAIATQMLGPYLALSPMDATALQVGPGDAVECCLAGTAYRLPVRVEADLPRGVAGLPVGLPAFQAIGATASAQGVGRPVPLPPDTALPLPTWSTLSKAAPP